MIDYHSQLVTALNTVLPTHYEMLLSSGTQTPCISYMLLNDAVDVNGDTIGYATITFQVKVWSSQISDLQTYSLQIDNALRPLGFKRNATSELYDKNSSMMQKILTYSARYIENF